MPSPIPSTPEPKIWLAMTTTIGRKVLCTRAYTAIFRHDADADAGDAKTLAVKERIVAHTRWN